MALRKRSDRGGSMIWPGFVDAMTALLLVLMFVLSIFMIVQFALREDLTGMQAREAVLESELSQLSGQITQLTQELTDAREAAGDAESELAALTLLLEQERARVGELTIALDASEQRGARLEDELATRVGELQALAGTLEERELRVSELEAIAARLTEERDEAQSLVAGAADTAVALTEAEAEAARLAAEAEAVRAALAEAEARARDAELTLQERVAALELALEAKVDEAVETLELLAAAQQREAELTEEMRLRAQAMSREEQAAAFARAALAGRDEELEASRQAIALLNVQVETLRRRLAGLEASLREAEVRDAENQVIIENLGARLNQALAERVSELQRYRSEFFGRMREILGDRDDIKIVGDRFVFQSEVLFASGSAELGEAGKRELARFAAVLRQIGREIPGDVAWILRVDGHTDIVPINPGGEFADNWELSQARALSVVNFLIDSEGIPPERLAATGFGEHQPIAQGRSTEALAANRRIELKFTER